MKKILYLFLITFLQSGIAKAQDYVQQIEKHREHYRAEFLTSSNSPLKKEDLAYLRFYEPDSTYVVHATFERTTESVPFEMPTYSGKKKNYVKYGLLTCAINEKKQSLGVYRSLDLAALPQDINYLFIPFKDNTSGKETYGGGRYLDVKTTDVKDGMLMLDFNKAYNPYCAYSSGYNCPIPPKENVLDVAIKAGEMNYAKDN